MLMATHGALSVRRRPSSSQPIYTYLFALIILISTYHVVAAPTGKKNDPNVDSLLKFKSGLENSGSLESWKAGTTPCVKDIAKWKGVLCVNGNVHGLQLENMELSGEIDMDSVAQIKTLRSLSFKNNSFEGPMPDWRKQPSLKAIYVSNNQFSGDIPGDSFAGLNRLKKVDLGNNAFTGRIPSSLSAPSLTELTLQNNKFSGPIPEFKQGIKIFDLSNNQLEGPIPQSIAVYDARSFSGNKGLCGKPTSTVCQNPKAKTNAVLIAIIVISVLIVIVLLAIVLYKCCRRKNKRYDSVMKPFAKPSSRTEHFEDPEIININHNHKPEIKKVENTPTPNKLTFVKEDREQFDLHELLKSSAEVLGSGNFGSSFKATLPNGQGFVVKRFNHMNSIEKEDFLEHMRRIGRLEHSNLLPIVAYFYRKEEKLLVFDHVQNGSLSARLHGNASSLKPNLDWPTRLGIVKGVSQGLVYLHTKLPSITVAHGHLKSSNVVLDKNMNPRLMDYGLTPVINADQCRNLLVSYRSPEYSQTGRVYKKTDVWCLGILILEILTGKIPTNYVVAQNTGYDSSLSGWIDSIIREDSLEVVDKKMEYSGTHKVAILKLLRIGAACCREDMNDRIDLEEAANMIEELREREY